MENYEIYVAKENKEIQGFNFRPGFIALFEKENILAATSGWESGGCLMVYRQDSKGNWQGKWEDEEDGINVPEILQAIADYEEKVELEKALKFAEGKKLKISETPLKFTDEVPGKKCNDGGEYGFYTVYCPTENPGIYRVMTETTCNFDSCGTGYQGIRALTVSEYRKLKKESDKVEAAGSLY